MMQPVLSIFSFRGRMCRLAYGCFTLASLPVCFVATVTFVDSLIITTLKFAPADLTAQFRTDPHVDSLLGTPIGLALSCLILSALLLVALYVAWTASAVRRLHDMNVTGWAVVALILVAGVPYAIMPPAEWSAYAGAVVVGLALSIWPASTAAGRFGPDARVRCDGVDTVVAMA